METTKSKKNGSESHREVLEIINSKPYRGQQTHLKHLAAQQ